MSFFLFANSTYHYSIWLIRAKSVLLPSKFCSDKSLFTSIKSLVPCCYTSTGTNQTVTKWHLHSLTFFPSSPPYYFSLLLFSSLHLLELKHGSSPTYPSLLSSQKLFLTLFSYTKMTLHALQKTSTPTTPSFMHQNPSLHLVPLVV